VRIFLRDFPDSVNDKNPIGKDTHTALWHNNKVKQESEWVDRKAEEWPMKKIIRKMIVTAIIRDQNEKMQNLVQRF
jgi:hypothetical protein